MTHGFQLIEPTGVLDGPFGDCIVKVTDEGIIQLQGSHLGGGTVERAGRAKFVEYLEEAWNVDIHITDRRQPWSFSDVVAVPGLDEVFPARVIGGEFNLQTGPGCTPEPWVTLVRSDEGGHPLVNSVPFVEKALDLTQWEAKD